MGHYPAYICENGHEISSFSNFCGDRFCKECGKPVINKCTNCGSVIKGLTNDPYGFILEYVVPAYCPDCGKPYPWTIAAIEATACLLDFSEEVSYADRENLKKLLPDAVAQTPRTTLAAAFFKKIMDATDSVVTEGLVQFALKSGCDLFRKSLGL